MLQDTIKNLIIYYRLFLFIVTLIFLFLFHIIKDKMVFENVEVDAAVFKLQGIFSRINKAKYNEVSDLEFNRKYYVFSLECIRTVHSDCIIVTVEDN